MSIALDDEVWVAWVLVLLCGSPTNRDQGIWKSGEGVERGMLELRTLTSHKVTVGWVRSWRYLISSRSEPRSLQGCCSLRASIRSERLILPLSTRRGYDHITAHCIALLLLTSCHLTPRDRHQLVRHTQTAFHGLGRKLGGYSVARLASFHRVAWEHWRAFIIENIV